MVNCGEILDYCQVGKVDAKPELEHGGDTGYFILLDKSFHIRLTLIVCVRKLYNIQHSCDNINFHITN